MKWAVLLAAICIAQGAVARPNFIIYNQYITVPQTLQFVSSSPGANQALSVPPRQIVLNFSQNLRADDASFTVLDPYNNPVPVSNITINANSMSAYFPPNYKGGTGAYKVQWKAACLCQDTNELSDFFFFNIQ